MSKTAEEQMLAGEPFLAGDPYLLERAVRARKLTKKFNDAEIDDPHKMDYLRELFAKTGEEFWVEGPIFVDYGDRIDIGERSFLNTNCTLLDNNWITIGKEVLVAPGVQILTANHPLKSTERCVYPYPDEPERMNFVNISAPITIGDNCWIGAGSIILPGVTIGARTTIGAGSIVTKDIPADCVAVGNPARVVKNL